MILFTSSFDRGHRTIQGCQSVHTLIPVSMQYKNESRSKRVPDVPRIFIAFVEQFQTYRHEAFFIHVVSSYTVDAMEEVS